MKISRISLLLIAGICLSLSYIGCKSTAFTSAKLYLQQENYPKAIEFLEQEVATNPINDEAFYLLGYCYGRDGRFAEMNENFEKSLAISKKFEPDIKNTQKKYWIDNFNSGVRNLQNDKAEEAIKDFETAILIDPEAADTYKNLAYAYVKLNNTEKSIEYYKKALDLDPEDTQTMLTLGIQYYSNKRYDETIQMMERILKIDSENKDAISYLALSYDLQGNRDKAVAAYDDALAKNPKDSDLYFNRGRLFYVANEYEKAALDFEKVVELTPNDFEAVYNVGNTYLSIGENIQKERKALEEKDGDQNKIKELKEKEKNNYQKAKKYLEQAKEINPDHAGLWNNLGVCYIRLGMVKEGEAAFKKADELGKK